MNSRIREYTWVIRNNGVSEAAAALVFFVGGGFLAYQLRGSELNSNEGAAFLLGLLMSFVGALGLLFCGSEVVEVDPVSKVIRVSRKTILGKRARIIPFSTVSRVSVSQLGQGTEGSPNYFLTLHLKNGKETNLLVGFYPGFTSKDTAMARKERLMQLLASK